MDKEMVAQLANDVNNVVLATAKPYQEQIQQLRAENRQLKEVIQKAIENMQSHAVTMTDNWQTGMFCGLEDRNITDRYDACMYGYNEAIEKVQEWVIEELEAENEK